MIDAVEKEGMSRRAAARRFGVSDSAAIKWVQRAERTGSRKAMSMGGPGPEVLKPHHDFLIAVRAQQPDITLEALSHRLLAEHGAKADTSMLSRYFRRHGITFKERRWSRASRTAQT
ncbi:MULTISPECIES: transposase [unclassified Mesorhizobium]|uniref:transposase n=1 Tax=unclassified Mesorhizobium TaxID=325217 RepID=UPI000F75B586|nr:MULTISPECIES: transposase [unclassified Mesorhizobium]AZO05042.1 transposase [Mesorhizobium sp. M2A.F.Ca.ET.043.02.1.1]RWB42989.1 MAG: transposase [Mesorhizobium sp.]RWB55482.1 MAG: transposase [Mesorhizobium sp.]RWB88046.1 MAG: transposase [Mesorhizobium sp.]RWC12735.1 MAG: transposase [Mesorhizobium sp.]